MTIAPDRAETVLELLNIASLVVGQADRDSMGKHHARQVSHWTDEETKELVTEAWLELSRHQLMHGYYHQCLIGCGR